MCPKHLPVWQRILNDLHQTGEATGRFSPLLPARILGILCLDKVINSMVLKKAGSLSMLLMLSSLPVMAWSWTRPSDGGWPHHIIICRPPLHFKDVCK